MWCSHLGVLSELYQENRQNVWIWWININLTASLNWTMEIDVGSSYPSLFRELELSWGFMATLECVSVAVSGDPKLFHSPELQFRFIFTGGYSSTSVCLFDKIPFSGSLGFVVVHSCSNSPIMSFLFQVRIERAQKWNEFLLIVCHHHCTHDCVRLWTPLIDFGGWRNSIWSSKLSLSMLV